MLLTAAAFIFVLGILIFFHELGHFVVAKKMGVRVDSFSLGFPPHIFKRKWGETEYCIGIIPLGGYVKMAGENPDEDTTGDPGEFASKSIGQRAAVMVAGPLMNYLLTIGIIIGLFYFVGTPYVDTDRVVVGEVQKDSPAEQAGLQTGDQIVAVDDHQVASFDSMRVLINAVVEAPVTIHWTRGSDTLFADITTQIGEQRYENGDIDTVGVIGIGEQVAGYNKYGFGEAIVQGTVTGNVVVWRTAEFLWKLITLQVPMNMLGGPVFIAQQAGKEARRGAAPLFEFIAVLSASLAVLNIQPLIPVLDGGQLLFLLIEKLRGRPLAMESRIKVQYVGILAVLGLIVFVTYNDVVRYFGL